MTQTVRSFVALELPEVVSVALEETQALLQTYPATRGLKWVDPYDAHLTLKFLGEIPIPQLPLMVDTLDTIAERWDPFDVTLESLGAFPNVHRPNVLWVGVAEGHKMIIHLYNAVEVALKKLGIKPERGEFFPHITLARVPKEWTGTQQEAVGNLVGTVELPQIPSFKVDAIALMRSVLTPEGPEYTRIGNSRFNESPPLQDDDWEDEE
jgi:2'-5' RNA ligase